jgi:PAXNEB protein
LSQNQALLIPVADSTLDTEQATLVSSSWSDAATTRDDPSITRGLAWPSERAIRQVLLDQLPRNLHLDRQADATNSTRAQLDTLAEEDEEQNEHNGIEDEGLVVAWQYRKDVQEERLGLKSHSISSTRTTSSTFCHSYDLQGRLGDQIDVQERATLIPMARNSSTSRADQDTANLRQSGYSYYRCLVNAIQERLHSKPAVIRLLFHHAEPSMLAVVLPLLLHHVRQHKLPVVTMVAVPPANSMRALSRHSFLHLQRSADVVLSCDSFATRRQYPPPAEFHRLHGLLAVKRASTCTLATCAGHFADLTVEKRPTAVLYGLQRDQRKLHISLLHIPPEDYAADGSSVGTSAVRSGGGRPPSASSGPGPSCASSSGGSPLDF